MIMVDLFRTVQERIKGYRIYPSGIFDVFI